MMCMDWGLIGPVLGEGGSMTDMYYKVEVRGADGTWKEIHGQPNRFVSDAEARRAIERLRHRGDDWDAQREYRVVEVDEAR